MQKPIFVSILLLSLLSTACVTNKTSTVVSINYNKQKNHTDYTVLPYGTVSMPGKWEKGHLNSTSNQQFFRNAESIEIAVALGRFDKYEFNQTGQFKGWNFVQAFCEWEMDYFFTKKGLANAILVEDQVRNFIIYRVYDANEIPKIDTYFLIGEINGNVRNISISITDKWTSEQKVTFLKSLF